MSLGRKNGVDVKKTTEPTTTLYIKSLLTHGAHICYTLSARRETRNIQGSSSENRTPFFPCPVL